VRQQIAAIDSATWLLNELMGISWLESGAFAVQLFPLKLTTAFTIKALMLAMNELGGQRGVKIFHWLNAAGAKSSAKFAVRGGFQGRPVR
jgi:hypothetical protein